MLGEKGRVKENPCSPPETDSGQNLASKPQKRDDTQIDRNGSYLNVRDSQ